MAIHRRGELYSWAFTVVSVTLACIGVITHFIEPGHPRHLFVWGFILGAAFWWLGIFRHPDIFCCKLGSHKWNYELATDGKRFIRGERWCTRCPKRQTGTPVKSKSRDSACGCIEWRNTHKPQERKS